MKFLIAEDDLVTREILKRVLRQMSDEIVEASNGVEALELIETEDPDFLFTDLQMPLLDGMAVVEAVRGSKSRSTLPIVCMSSVKDRDEITRLVALGIADYILKPIRPQEMHERLRAVIARHAGWRDASSGLGQRALILVDSDPEWPQLAVAVLEDHFAVQLATTGAQALRLFQTSTARASVVVVSEELSLLSEVQIVSMLRKLSLDAHINPPAFWLLSAGGEVAPEVAAHFTGTIRRALDAETLADEFRRTLLHDQEGAASPH